MSSLRSAPVATAPPSKRPNRQQVAAAATRREILLAARRLFAERGYAKTSVADIAEAAGVSVPTIYASVGTKKAIVMALVALVGTEVGQTETMARSATESDPIRLIGLGARLNRRLLEDAGDIVGALRSAAQVEPDVAAAVEEGQRWHRRGATRLAHRLKALHALKRGVGVGEAADVIALLTDIDCYAVLVRQYGWTFERAERWIGNTLRTLLLED